MISKLLRQLCSTFSAIRRNFCGLLDIISVAAKSSVDLIFSLVAKKVEQSCLSTSLRLRTAQKTCYSMSFVHILDHNPIVHILDHNPK